MRNLTGEEVLWALSLYATPISFSLESACKVADLLNRREYKTITEAEENEMTGSNFVGRRYR